MKRTLYKIRCSEKINNVRIIHGWLDFESDLRIIAEDMVQDFNENRRLRWRTFSWKLLTLLLQSSVRVTMRQSCSCFRMGITAELLKWIAEKLSFFIIYFIYNT